MDEKLKQIFVGAKYEKFEKKKFSFPAFLFGSIYLAYRKMLKKAIIVSIFCNILSVFITNGLGVLDSLIAFLCINIAIGLYFPIWYRDFYVKSVEKIMKNNSNSEDELIKKVQEKGGTSVGYIIIFIIINIIVISMFNKVINNVFAKKDINTNNVIMDDTVDFVIDEKTNINENAVKNEVMTSTKLIENVKVYGHVSNGSEYELFISDKDKDEKDYSYDKYACTRDIFECLHFTGDYDVYLKIYVTEDETPKIVDYEMFNSKTNEEIIDVYDEPKLRDLFGLYNEGEYEEEFIFVKNVSNAFGMEGMPGVSFSSDNETYTFYDLLFKKLDEEEIQLEYRVYNDEENKVEEFEENQKYKIKFKVEKSSFKFNYIISAFEKI